MSRSVYAGDCLDGVLALNAKSKWLSARDVLAMTSMSNIEALFQGLIALKVTSKWFVVKDLYALAHKGRCASIRRNSDPHLKCLAYVLPKVAPYGPLSFRLARLDSWLERHKSVEVNEFRLERSGDLLARWRIVPTKPEQLADPICDELTMLGIPRDAYGPLWSILQSSLKESS